MFRYYWKQAWVDPNGGGVLPVDAAIQNSGELMIGWLDSVQNPNPPYNIAVHNILINTTQPSYAVLVDPVGFRTQSQASPGPRADYQSKLCLRELIFLGEPRRRR